MKKFLKLLIAIILCYGAKAQFPGTDSLRNFNNRFITNNPQAAFTNLRLHNLLAGIVDWIDTARSGGGGTIGVDTIYAVNDSTLRYRKSGVFRTFIVRGTSWAGKIYEVPFSNGFGRFYRDSNFIYVNNVPDATQLTIGPLTVNSGGLSKVNITSDNMNSLALTSYGTGLNTIIARRANGTVAIPTAISNTNDLWNFSGRGYTGTQWSGTRAGFYARAAQNWTDSTNGSELHFQTTHNDSITAYDRMIIEPDGHIILPGYGYLKQPTDSTLLPLGYDRNTARVYPLPNWNNGQTNDWCKPYVDITGNIDASSAIQTLINSGCKHIQLPAGKIKLATTVRMKDSITIQGDAKGTVIILPSNSYGLLCSSKAGQWCTFKDFSMMGSYNLDSSFQEGIHVDTCKGILFENLYFFKTSGYAIHFYKNISSTESNTVTHCYFDSCRRGPWAESEFNKFIGNTFAYCDTALKISHGNNTVQLNHITKGSIGIYLYGYLAGGEFNDGHTIMTNNLIAHQFFAGLYVNGIQNGERIGHNIIRNNSVYDVYAQNSDALWFDNNDIGIDSLVFVNCTNLNMPSTNNFWSSTTGRPCTPDQFPKWRVTGTDTITIAGSGWVKNAFSLYDVINNKTFSIKHSNNVIDLVTTNTGKIRTSDTLITPVISGSESASGTLKLYSTTNSTKGKIFFGDSSVYDPTNFRIGINTISPASTMELRRSFGNTLIDVYCNSTNGLAGIRFLTPGFGTTGQIFGGSTSAPFVPGNGFEVDGVSYLGLSSGGDIIFTNSTSLNLAGGSGEHGRITSGHHWLINKAIGTDNGSTLQIGGAVTIKKDSIPLIGSVTSQYVVLQDSLNNGLLNRISISNLISSQISTLQNFITGVSNTGTSETDLFSYTIPANTLQNDGEKINFEMGGQFFDPTANITLIHYFAGSSIFNSGALTLSTTGAWSAKITVIRTSSSTAKTIVTFNADNTTVSAPVKYTSLSSLDFTTTNIIKVTGTSGGIGGGSGDVSADMGFIQWIK